MNRIAKGKGENRNTAAVGKSGAETRERGESRRKRKARKRAHERGRNDRSPATKHKRGGKEIKSPYTGTFFSPPNACA